MKQQYMEAGNHAMLASDLRQSSCSSKYSQTLQSSRRAFTLIELLIVIAIIAILAAILFPVFARARENARRASCQANMKQLGIALTMYSQDYDEKVMGTNSTPGPTSWTLPLDPYIKNLQILRCPSVKKTTARSDYFRNFHVMGSDMRDSTQNIAIPYMQICNTSMTAFAMDGVQGSSTENVSCRVSLSLLSDVHFDGFNAAFFDGHVKWYAYDRAKVKHDGTIAACDNTTRNYPWINGAGTNFYNSAVNIYSPSIWFTAP